ncbi:hypothetical protein GCM10027589_09060 [Actinocorallia lasiicapitis]
MAAQEVTAAEIARMVGVSRAAVSNWRRRYLDFPDPVGGPSSSPTFSWQEIEAWLRANNRTVLAGSVPAREPDEADESLPDDRLVARLLASLMAPLDSGLVLDPACGRGETLLAALALSRGGVDFAGQDVDLAAVEDCGERFGRARRHLAEIAVGSPFGEDRLARFRQEADAVLCLPPLSAVHPARPVPLEDLTYDQRWEFGLPAASDLVGCWSQMCYSYLKPGGTAVIAFPEDLTGRPAGRRIRAELVRSGALRSVIQLPAAFGGRHAPLHIWMMERVGVSPDRTVRMVDLSGLSPEQVPTDPHAWDAVYTDQALTRTVAAIDLLDEEVALVPSLYVIPPVADVVAAFQSHGALLTRHLAEFAAGQPFFGPSQVPPLDFPLIEIEQLEQAGSLEIPPRTAGLRSGDVVVPMTPDEPPLVVAPGADLSGLNRHRGSLQILRCDPSQLDPYFVAGFLQSEINRRQLRSGSTGEQRSPRRARIPRIPLAEQRVYGEVFRGLFSWLELLRRMDAVAKETYGLALNALTSGALDPHESPSVQSAVKGSG